jgi:hypothetical protein
VSLLCFSLSFVILNTAKGPINFRWFSVSSYGECSRTYWVMYWMLIDILIIFLRNGLELKAEAILGRYDVFSRHFFWVVSPSSSEENNHPVFSPFLMMRWSKFSAALRLCATRLLNYVCSCVFLFLMIWNSMFILSVVGLQVYSLLIFLPVF